MLLFFCCFSSNWWFCIVFNLKVYIRQRRKPFKNSKHPYTRTPNTHTRRNFKLIFYGTTCFALLIQKISLLPVIATYTCIPTPFTMATTPNNNNNNEMKKHSLQQQQQQGSNNNKKNHVSGSETFHLHSKWDLIPHLTLCWMLIGV